MGNTDTSVLGYVIVALLTLITALLTLFLVMLNGLKSDLKAVSKRHEDALDKHKDETKSAHEKIYERLDNQLNKINIIGSEQQHTILKQEGQINENSRNITELRNIIIPTRYDLTNLFIRVAKLDNGTSELRHTKSD